VERIDPLKYSVEETKYDKVDLQITALDNANRALHSLCATSNGFDYDEQIKELTAFIVAECKKMAKPLVYAGLKGCSVEKILNTPLSDIELGANKINEHIDKVVKEAETEIEKAKNYEAIKAMCQNLWEDHQAYKKQRDEEWAAWSAAWHQGEKLK